MHALPDEIETIHLYVVPEREQRPYAALPLLCAVLCLLGIAAITLYSGVHPYYKQQRLTVPAQPVSLGLFTVHTAVLPTGVKTYPATNAHGFLTFSNGSVIGQSIPQGFTIDGAATDRPVYVPAATANGFGVATVPAHLVTAGINKPTLAINEVVGASLFIRNLSPFTGGRPTYSVRFVTPADRALALNKSRVLLSASVAGFHYPCSEAVSGALTVTWRCQFVSYTLPAHLRVLRARLVGHQFIVDVALLPRSLPFLPR